MSVSEKIGAIVVSYFPDQAFASRIGLLAAQFEHVWIIDNTSPTIAGALLLQEAAFQNVSVVSLGENKGIAAALNKGFKLAKACGMDCCITFDQDTCAHSNTLSGLLSLRHSIGKDALIGANYYNVNKLRPRVHSNHTGYIHCKTLINAGMLVPKTIFEATGGFREEYFIDSVDHEFCLNARRHGFDVVMSCQPLISQTIGESMGRAPRWLTHIRAFNHVPSRKYYIGRNIVATIHKYWRLEPIWCVKQIGSLFQHFLSILLFESEKRNKITALSVGIAHGWKNKMGNIQNSWPGCAEYDCH